VHIRLAVKYLATGQTFIKKGDNVMQHGFSRLLMWHDDEHALMSHVD
jgi:hypothetical protein